MVHLNGFRRATPLGLWVALIVLVAGLAACLPVPLGSPSESKIDPAFTGVWYREAAGHGMLFIVAPFDDHAYTVEWLGWKEEGGVRVPNNVDVWKAWITPVAGKTFVSLTDVMTPAIEPRKSTFAVALLTLNGDTLDVRSLKDVSPETAAKLKTPDDLRRMIEHNPDDPTLYKKPMKLTKLVPGRDDAKIKQLLKPFNTH